MLPHLAGVVLEQQLARDVVHGAVHGVEIGGERRLCVDDHRLPARQPHHQVGAQPAIVALDAGLLLEVAVVEHARHLDHAPELDLAPAAAHLRRAERLHQVPGLGLQRLLGLRHRPDLLDQPGVGRDALLLDLLQLAVDPRERLLDRPHQVAHRLLPSFEVRRGALLKLAELGLGEREEALVVLPERLGGERGEGVAQTGLGALKQRDLFAGGAALGVEPFLQPGDAAPAGEPGRERADREGYQEERKVHSACVWQDDGGGDTSARRPTNVPTRLRADNRTCSPNNPHPFPAPGRAP